MDYEVAAAYLRTLQGVYVVLRRCPERAILCSKRLQRNWNEMKSDKIFINIMIPYVALQ